MKQTIAYVHRAARHLSPPAITWLAVTGALFAMRGFLSNDWVVNLSLFGWVLLVLRALWRARRPSVVLTHARQLIITNPWRTYRLNMGAVQGYVRVPPPWLGRDNAPVVAVVEDRAGSTPRRVRIDSLSGAAALEDMRVLGLGEVAGPNGP
jgi:hypothetical protein